MPTIYLPNQHIKRKMGGQRTDRQMLDRLKTPLDWVQRWVALWQGLVGFGVGKLVEAILKLYTNLSPIWITPIWLLIAAAVWAALAYWSKRKESPLQPAGARTSTQIVTQAVGLEDNIKHVEEFYKNNAGRLRDEIEKHFERLLAHFVTSAERERFLFRANVSGALASFHDTTWNSIFRSQLELLQELNARALTLDQARPFYDSAALANPALYSQYSFEQWLSYMRGQSIVLQDGNVLQITVRGTDFLRYLVLNRKSAKERFN